MPVIAIDGPSGSGKTTVAALLGQQLGVPWLSSGALYRAATRLTLDRLGPEAAPPAVAALVRSVRWEVAGGAVTADGRALTAALHSAEIDRHVAPLSAIPGVRAAVNEALRLAAGSGPWVVEGRDIGTEVFPGAVLKVFLEAAPEVRAARRARQRPPAAAEAVAQIAAALAERDRRDRQKPIGALRPAADARRIDTSRLTVVEVCAKLCRIVPSNFPRSNPVRTMSDSEMGVSPPQSFESQLQEQYITRLDRVEEGQLITGRVIEVGPETVFVDVGLKSEGRIPIDEFAEPPHVDDEVSVVLLRKEGRHGEVVVSKRKADEQVVWRALKESGETGEPVTGRVTRKIKGGYEVDLGAALRAFVPFSKVDVMRVRDEDAYIGLDTRFFVEQLYNRGKVNIVLNRKAWLEREAKKKRDQFYETAAIGDVYRGTVKTFTSFGAFVDLGGFDGLLHVNDMRWGHVASPKDAVVIGEELDVKVIRIDRDSQKVNLSLKHFTPDPWTTFEERYSLEDLVTGKVTKITDFGAFIEIEAGIEGLLHISDMSWVKKIGHPREILGNGDEVQVKILAYDLERGKLSLGLKHVLPNPWDTAEERYPPGKVVKGIVRNITSYGAFVQLEEGIDGLLHVDDMSWTKKVRNPASVVQADQELEVAVVDLDKKARRIRLGLKQLSDDPWVALARAFRRGSVIEGQVTSKTDFGVFVRVQGGIEGLIANNQLAGGGGNADKVREDLEPGAQIKAVVTEVSAEKQRLSLSLRELRRREERQELVKYIHDDEQPDRVSLGEFLKDRSSTSNPDE